MNQGSDSIQAESGWFARKLKGSSGILTEEIGRLRGGSFCQFKTRKCKDNGMKPFSENAELVKLNGEGNECDGTLAVANTVSAQRRIKKTSKCIHQKKSVKYQN